MYAEDALLPISALQHLIFCERQCALIHLERQWVENRLTAEGRLMHAKAHDGADEMRGNVRISRGLALKNERLGLIGVSDVVEFRTTEDGGRHPFPIEYKRGKPKAHAADLVQLCAQAFCLEEMFSVDIPAGALFYGEPKRRTEVAFDDRLRQLTMSTIIRLHALLAGTVTPPARREKKCQSCSLLAVCLPEPATANRAAARYFEKAFQLSLADSETGA